MRIVKMMSGNIFPITDGEFSNLVTTDGLVYVPSSGEMINTKSIESIQTYDNYLARLKMNSKDGILHDGTKVYRSYGEWKIQGKPDIKLDPTYYPEIANDTVEPVNPLKEQILMIEDEQTRKNKAINQSKFRRNNQIDK